MSYVDQYREGDIIKTDHGCIGVVFTMGVDSQGTFKSAILAGYGRMLGWPFVVPEHFNPKEHTVEVLGNTLDMMAQQEERV